MPIINNPTGQAAATAQAGAMIGKAEKAKADKAQMFQVAAEERAMNWELQKMEINSQQAFAHELRMNQAALEAEARAREWEVEKAEMASRIDFERKERDRQTKLAELDSIKKAIDKSGLDEETKTFMKFKADFEHLGMGLSPEDVGLVTSQNLPIWEHPGIKGTPAGDALRVADLGIIGEAKYQESLNNQNTGAQDPDGIRSLIGEVNAIESIINPKDVEKAKTLKGNIEVKSPNGKTAIIPLNDWKDYKSKGYTFIKEVKDSNNIPYDYYRGYGGRGV